MVNDSKFYKIYVVSPLFSMHEFALVQIRFYQTFMWTKYLLKLEYFEKIKQKLFSDYYQTGKTK